jgi:membrane protein DedA with SNARE-associated domain
MEALAQWFQDIAPFIGQYRYPLLIAITVLEGTWVVIAAGIMSAADLLSPPWTYLACLAGTTLGGFFWYGVGYWAGAWPLEKFMHSTPVRRALLDRIRRHSNRSAGIIVFFTKLMYGATVPTLIIVGSLRYDLKRFTWYNFAGTFIWTSALFWGGFGVGRPVVEFLASLRFTGVVIVVLVLGVLITWGLRTSSNWIFRKVQAAIPEEET